jgi:carbon starvation protein
VLQDLLRPWCPPLADGTRWWAVLLTSGVVVAMWGWFLIAGVRDPLGGIYVLWPLFGISNQLLAVIALCVGTVVITRLGKIRWAWVTILPLVVLLAITFTAGLQKLTHPSAKVSFLVQAAAKEADADHLAAQANDLRATPVGTVDPAAQAKRDQALADLAKKEHAARQIAFNNRLDAWICGLFLAIILVVVIDGARAVWQYRRGVTTGAT